MVRNKSLTPPRALRNLWTSPYQSIPSKYHGICEFLIPICFINDTKFEAPKSSTKNFIKKAISNKATAAKKTTTEERKIPLWKSFMENGKLEKQLI
jgi:hypothetical protein